MNFSTVQLNAKFVYKNCLFIKDAEGTAKMVGEKKLTSFEASTEVGEVKAEAHAPSETVSPTPTPDKEESDKDE